MISTRKDKGVLKPLGGSASSLGAFADDAAAAGDGEDVDEEVRDVDEEVCDEAIKDALEELAAKDAPDVHDGE